MEKITLFHGALEEIKVTLDRRTTSKSTDFCDGFYLTEIQKQTEIWAKRKYDKIGKYNKFAKPIVNIYTLDREKVLTNFKSKYFKK